MNVMTLSLRQKVKFWMIQNIDNFKNNIGDINMTRLAEEATEEFDLYDIDYNCPEWVFDLACDVTESYE